MQGPDVQLVFRPLPPPTDEDIQRLTERLAERLGALARHRMEQAELDPPWDQDDDAHVLASNAEALRTPSPQLQLGLAAPPVERGKPLCAKVDGFSLHAARTVEADDREGLERLCRYGLRSPLSLERLSVGSEGRVQYMAELSGRSSARTKPMPFGYRLRKPWFDGRTEIVFDPIVFLRRLAALIPAPYTNLVRYHGIFANRSRFRDRLPPPPAADDVQKPPPGDDGTTPEVEDDGADVSPHRKRPRRLAWAHLLRRVLDIDVLTCPKCDASMTIIAFLTDHNVLTKILDHLKGHQVTKTAFHAIQEGSVPGRDVPVRSLQPFHDTDEVFTNSQARFGGR